MECKARGQETTRIILTFSVSKPENMDIKVENDYEELSAAICINNKKVLHEVLDKAIDKIASEIINKTMIQTIRRNKK